MSNNIEKLSAVELAYLAGFLDGDGAIFAQIVRGDSYKYKFHIRVTIGFYQHKSKHWYFMQLRQSLGNIGVLRQRENISEYTITGSESVMIFLNALMPFLVLKKPVANLVLDIINKKKSVQNLQDFIEICVLVDKVSMLTYGKKRSIDSEFVKNFFKSP